MKLYHVRITRANGDSVFWVQAVDIKQASKEAFWVIGNVDDLWSIAVSERKEPLVV